MKDAKMSKEIITVPRNLNPDISKYLGLLCMKKSNLMIKDSLRGRKYSKGPVSYFEKTVTTKEINYLIDNGLLIKEGVFEGFNLFKPHPYVISFLKNKGNNTAFCLSEKSNSVAPFRPLIKGERTQLLRKAKVLSIKNLDQQFTVSKFKEAAFKNGYDYGGLFQLLGLTKPVYILIGLQDSTIYQVFPANVEIKTKNKQPKDKIPIEYRINDNQITIVSDKYSTSYINIRRKNYPTYVEIVNSYTEAKKLLNEYKIPTKGKKELNAFFKQQKYKEVYEKTIKEKDALFKDLQDCSIKLVEQGIVHGGFEKNPLYKEAWGLQNKIRATLGNSELRYLVNKYQRCLNVIELHSKNELANYNSYTF